MLFKAAFLCTAVSLFSFASVAQTASLAPTQTAQPQDEHAVDIDLTDFCHEQEEIDQKNAANSKATTQACSVPPVTQLTDQFKLITPLLAGDVTEDEKKRTCQSIYSLRAIRAEPVEMKLKDDKGESWKFRFHFGFTRTNIRATDVNIKSTAVNTTIKGFQFDERTSGEHYNPKTWKNAQDAARWLDEPSNTFTFSVEKKNNAIYLTAFHPKFLKTYYEIKGTDSSGKPTVNYVPASEYLSNGNDKSYSSIPDGQSAIEIQNTHKLMSYQIGYGRKVTIFDDKQAGKLTYIARVDAGITVGAARSIRIVKGESWDENTDKSLSIQGTNASIGQRIEYQRGKLGVFVDQKYTRTNIEHPFLDGTANYNLDYSTVTFGVSFDIYTKKKKN